MQETTLVIIKPDAVKRGIMGQIMAKIEGAGLVIEECCLTTAARSRMDDHYRDLGQRHGPEVQKQVVDFMVSGPIMVMLVTGENAVQVTRDLMGATDPAKAKPGTIRNRFADDSMDAARAENRCVRNVMHASATIEEAREEIETWFSTGPLPFVNLERYFRVQPT